MKADFLKMAISQVNYLTLVANLKKNKEAEKVEQTKRVLLAFAWLLPDVVMQQIKSHLCLQQWHHLTSFL